MRPQGTYFLVSKEAADDLYDLFDTMQEAMQEILVKSSRQLKLSDRRIRQETADFYEYHAKIVHDKASDDPLIPEF